MDCVTRRVAVGVTGHRLNQLPEADRPRLARTIARAMDRIEAAAKVGAKREPVRMTMVSGLAEGADRYAAYAALERDWGLTAALAFRPVRFLKDFETPESKAEFRGLLQQSKIVQPEGRGSYLAAGEIILDRADVLIALWNGAPPKGAGGTADVAARALAMGRPVLWIPVEARRPPRLIPPHRAPRKGVWRAGFHKSLAAAFRVGAQPEAMRLA
jgi:hypothetical protein